MESVIISERWQAILDSFNEYTLVKGLKLTTRHELKASVSEFILFAQNANNIEFPNQCNPKFLLSYFQYIITRPKGKTINVIQGSTPNHHVYALRTFFGWLFNAGGISSNPTVGLKFPKYFSRKVEAISVGSIQKLFQACESDLERVLLSVYYGCGLRRDEGQSLNLSDIDYVLWKVTVRKGKFGKRREVPISVHMQTHFINYLTSYHSEIYAAKDQAPFLIDENKNQINGNRSYQIIKQITYRANLTKEHINLHVLRHSIATHLLLNGMGIDYVCKFLGHNSMDTTQHYLKGIGTQWKWNQRNHLLRSSKSFNHDRT
ncbi:MAG: tyrosine-type recombinase/integrase [Bacteroidetes bacterium]|nr:tyrosine-type recombinase/integrase [Bacteroidota bacterium]